MTLRICYLGTSRRMRIIKDLKLGIFEYGPGGSKVLFCLKSLNMDLKATPKPNDTLNVPTPKTHSCCHLMKRYDCKISIGWVC